MQLFPIVVWGKEITARHLGEKVCDKNDATPTIYVNQPVILIFRFQGGIIHLGMWLLQSYLPF